MTEHVYLSTGCLHGEHGYCQWGGTKRPAQCKFCAAPCICHCHQGAAATPASAGEPKAPPNPDLHSSTEEEHRG